MSTQRAEPYGVPESLPLRPVAPGTNVLLTGAGTDATERLALRLVLAGHDRGEGTILVSTTGGRERLLRQCEAACGDLDRSRLGVVDCTGYSDAEPGDAGIRLAEVANPGDLSGIGMKFSDLYGGLDADGVRRVRTGLVSVSTLLRYADLRTVFRFLHTFGGRIEAMGGLGVFLVDAGSHDERTLGTLRQVCDGQIEVREGDRGPQLRAQGLPDQPLGWAGFDPGE